MKIKPMLLSDRKEIDKIYKEFFSDNEYPNFIGGRFHQSFVVTNDNEKIVVAGGVRNIAEVVVLTDKNQSVRVRLEALLQALGSSIHIALASKYSELHAFVSSGETEYIEHLKKHGFKEIDAKILVLDIGEANG